MSHSFLTPTKVIRAAMAEFQNNLSFVGQCKKISKKDYEIGGMKAGASINAAVPNNFSVRTGATFSGQDLLERSVAVPVDTQYGVDINGITTLDWTMSVDEFSQRFIKPAMANLAAKVEAKMLDIAAKGSGSLVGAAATTPNTLLVYLQAGQKLTELAAPFDGRSIHINPAANAATVDALKGLFNSQAQLSGQYAKGLMAKDTLGFDFYVNQSIPVITAGTRTASSSVTVKTTVSTEGATTIVLSGTSGCTYTAGDIFTVAGVYAVNPLTKQSTGALAQFCVTTLATAGATGTYDATVTVKTPMYSTGGHQNIASFPQAGDAVTFIGTASTAYPRNIYTVKEAVAFANVELQVPGGVDFAAAETVDGISLRVIRDYDSTYDTIKTRFDVAFGGAVLRPEWVGQLIG